jgi:hypothetical protein
MKKDIDEMKGWKLNVKKTLDERKAKKDRKIESWKRHWMK